MADKCLGKRCSMQPYKDSNKTLVGIGTDKQTEVAKKNYVAESKSKRLCFDSSLLSLLIFFPSMIHFVLYQIFL